MNAPRIPYPEGQLVQYQNECDDVLWDYSMSRAEALALVERKIRDGGGTVAQWYNRCMIKEVLIGSGWPDDTGESWPEGQVLVDQVYAAYQNWCALQGINHSVHKAVFGKRMIMFGVCKKRGPRPERRYCYAFERLPQARMLFAAALGVDEEVWVASAQ